MTPIIISIQHQMSVLDSLLRDQHKELGLPHQQGQLSTLIVLTPIALWEVQLSLVRLMEHGQIYQSVIKVSM